MTAPKGAKPIVIEPLDPAKHDRAGFSCGIEQVDNFFRRTANKLANADNVRTFVMVDPEGALIGFYATNAHGIDYTKLPERFARTRPAHGSIPAAYVSMIGVDSRFQGQGYGGDLLVDCLARLAGAAEALGIAVVMLDVLDCGDPNPSGPTSRIDNMTCACGLGLPSSARSKCTLRSATIPRFTNCSSTKSRASCTLCRWFISRGIENSTSRASCASSRFSPASTSFHNVVRSANRPGAPLGNITSEWMTPALFEKS